jgi:hypothetical protein
MHYDNLELAVKEHKPDVVACVGDFLCCSDPPRPGKRVTVAEAAQRLGQLPVPTVFTRGNHEDANWYTFIKHWPHDLKPLVCLHAAAESFGPLRLIGFPCTMGDDFHWLTTLPVEGNIIRPDYHLQTQHRKTPGFKHNKWLKPLVKDQPSGRMCWLSHIPTAALPIAHPDNHNPWFGDLVTHYQPKLVISGHDHGTPLRNNTWYVKDGDTVCVNTGQGNLETFYLLADFTFTDGHILPSKIELTYLPKKEKLIV